MQTAAGADLAAGQGARIDGLEAGSRMSSVLADVPAPAAVMSGARTGGVRKLAGGLEARQTAAGAGQAAGQGARTDRLEAGSRMSSVLADLPAPAAVMSGARTGGVRKRAGGLEARKIAAGAGQAAGQGARIDGLEVGSRMSSVLAGPEGSASLPAGLRHCKQLLGQIWRLGREPG